MEDWLPVAEFPGYSVSQYGRVRNDATERIMAPCRTGGGHLHVGMVRNQIQYKRALSKLVCETFMPSPPVHFDTPIHLDSDKSNCRLDNLLWRPRWFALKYTRQFDVPWEPVGRIRNARNGKVYEDIWSEVIMIKGLLFSEILESIMTNTYVFPTFDIFEWV